MANVTNRTSTAVSQNTPGWGLISFGPSHPNHVTRTGSATVLICPLVVFVAVMVGGSLPVAGQTDARPEVDIVFRMSRELFEDLTRDTIEMTIPIDSSAQGARVTGEATGETTNSVVLETSEGVAEFVVRAEGTAVATFVANADIISAHAHSNIDFTSETRIRFDGSTFSQIPTVVESTSRTRIDQVCSRRRGLVGRVVRCVAWRVLGRSRVEIEGEVTKMAQQLIARQADLAAKDLVSELNQTTKLDETLAKYFPAAAQWTYHLATTPRHIVAGAGPADATLPELPVADDDPLVEVWIRTRPVEAIMLSMLVDWELAYSLLKEFLPEEEAKEVADQVAVITNGGWSVIQIGRPAAAE